MRVLFSMVPLLLVVGYYGMQWYRANQHLSRAVVVQYEPPRRLSPALLRYIWKERFDDRTFWACLLSLVSKGLVILESADGKTYGRRTNTRIPHDVGSDESVLLDSLFSSHKEMSLQMDDPVTALAVWKLAYKLRTLAVGRWFYRNRNTVTAGTILSIVGVVIAADPQSLADWGALLFGTGVMVPAGYYFFFVTLRIVDLFHAARTSMTAAFASRLTFLAFMGLSCVGSFVLGAVVVTETFSWIPTATIGVLALINVVALLWLRLPTPSGSQLLNEIEGFRQFLLSVE